MQLATQTKDPDQKMSPTIYAALIDSLFQDPGPMFAGALCAAAIRVHRQGAYIRSVVRNTLYYVCNRIKLPDRRKVDGLHFN